jgi:hypothetical protein
MNPFPQIVALFNEEYKTVTIPLLDQVISACKTAGLELQSKDSAFAILEYLAENSVFDIIQANEKTFLIRVTQHGN